MKYRFKHFKSLDSTNNYVLEAARGGEKEGFVVSASYQTGGRGRGNHTWFSKPDENLLFSVLLRPPLRVNEAPYLTHLAALSVKEAILEHYPALRVTLKKPNDVLINKKKVCGILTESSAKSGRVEYVVVGFGVNVNSNINNDIEGSTSIKLEIKKKTEKKAIFKSILTIFRQKYMNLIHNGISNVEAGDSPKPLMKSI